MAFTDRFDSPFCGALLRCFWIAYRKGLQEAAATGDAYGCQEFLDSHLDPRLLGTLKYPEMDWIEWEFTVLQWMREDICKKRTAELVMSMRTKAHPLAFLMHITRLFYFQGIKDWIECGLWLTQDVISEMPPYPYLMKKKHSYRNSTRSERFEEFQKITLNYIKLQGLYKLQDEDFTPPSRIRTFIERVWSHMQRARWFDDLGWESEDFAKTEDEYDQQMEQKKEERRKKRRDEYWRKKSQADRPVSREDESGSDTAADGAVLQSGAPKRRRGRPPKIL